MSTNTYIQAIGIQPTGTYYTFTQIEIDKLIIDFVKNRTGFSLDLTVGCLDENFDVYVNWNDNGNEELFEAFQTYDKNSENPLGLNPEEDFMNRDNLFQAMFGVTVIAYEYNDEYEQPEYTLFIPTVLMNGKNNGE